MTPSEARALTEAIANWVQTQPTIKALGLAGSWAAERARPDSDLDLLILANNRQKYRENQVWLSDLLLPEPFRVVSHRSADYGSVWSCHALLQPDAQLELSFAGLEWALTDPIDVGTRLVVSNGFRVIVDKERRLQQLVAAFKDSV